MSILRIISGITVAPLISGPLSGCSTVGEIKSVLQEVSTTLTQIVTLTLAEPDGPTLEQLQAAEDKILFACRNLLETAHHSFEQEKIPLKTQVSASMTARQCEQTLMETQREVDELRHRSLAPQR